MLVEMFNELAERIFFTHKERNFFKVPSCTREQRRYFTIKAIIIITITTTKERASMYPVVVCSRKKYQSQYAAEHEIMKIE